MDEVGSVLDFWDLVVKAKPVYGCSKTSMAVSRREWWSKAKSSVRTI